MERNIYKIGKELFITSDKEIKEGDWCLGNQGTILKVPLRWISSGDWKKIILTTDQDLIKDGVQDIDDEFLKWFVNNSNCEFIEIFHQDVYSMGKWDRRYKIIIPKEEPALSSHPQMIEDLKPKKGVLIEGTINKDGVGLYFSEKQNWDIYPLMQDDIDHLTMRNYKPNGALIEAHLTECTSGGKTTIKAKLKSVNNILN